MFKLPRHYPDKVTTVAPGVTRVKVSGIVNVFFIEVVKEGRRSWVLVDTGMPNSAKAIIYAAEQKFGTNNPPTCIVLTHGHVDHAGSLPELLTKWNVPVYAHQWELPYLHGESYPPRDSSIGGAMSFISRVFPPFNCDVGDRVRPLSTHPFSSANLSQGSNVGNMNNMSNVNNQGMSSQGMSHQGMGQQGMGNVGMGNQGVSGQGMGNVTMGNQGVSGQGMGQQGMGNVGMSNVGNQGFGSGQGMSGQQGMGNVGMGNVGMSNVSNQGAGSIGSQGISGQGMSQQGMGQQGMSNVGMGNAGNLNNMNNIPSNTPQGQHQQSSSSSPGGVGNVHSNDWRIEEAELEELTGWKIYHTPGHTPGHIVLWRPRDRVLLVGDVLLTQNQDSFLSVLLELREFNRPPVYWTTDWVNTKKSIDFLAWLEPNIVASGHGAPIKGGTTAVDLRKFADSMKPPETGRYVNTPVVSNESGPITVPPPLQLESSMDWLWAVVGGASVVASSITSWLI